MMEALHIMREVGATWALVTADAGPEGEATVSAFPQLCSAHTLELLLIICFNKLEFIFKTETQRKLSSF